MSSTKTAGRTISKVVRVGTTRDGSLFCKAEYAQGKLSITGVIGPMRNGNAAGGCGQIRMEFAHRDPKNNDKRYEHPTQPIEIEFAPGWDEDKWLDFLDVWEEWHLNDMRAGCEHQRDIDTQEQIEVVTYGLTREARKLRQQTLQAAAQAALAGQPFTPNATARALAMLESEWESTHAAPDADSPLSNCYEVSKREVKAVGWVRPDEHPKGMLCRPCPVCGYKYGSAWLKQEVPAGVLDWIEALPDADEQPAWI